jgi:hypothetical protein
VGTLRTSEQDNVVAGEGRNADGKDENRRVDEAPKIIIDSGPLPITPPQRPAAAPPVPYRSATPTTMTAPKPGGLGVVIALYLIGAAALGYAIYERFL